MPPNDTVYYNSLGYFLALIPLSTTPEGFKKLLEDANTTLEVAKEPSGRGEGPSRDAAHPAGNL